VRRHPLGRCWNWAIENEGFNELSTRQHSDHVYRHHPQAMLVFLLLSMICCNVLLAFYQRDLKPALRDSVSMLHISRLIPPGQPLPSSMGPGWR